MNTPLTVSIDAMGGDNAPAMVVGGAALARADHPGVEFLLFGDSARLEPLVKAHPALAEGCRVRHSPTVITNEDKPSTALRGGRDSSMRHAIEAVAKGEAAAVVSAGNTGALMAIAKFVLRTLPGIDRPAICTSYPTPRGASVMLDLGANVECDANNLVQFAVMGEVFARHVLGLEEPSIGLLNVGVEVGKGNEAVKKAAAILQGSSLQIRFHGNIEGGDIPTGAVDVVVTDGFTGNIALKAIEGTAKTLGAVLKETLLANLLSRVGALIAKPSLDRFRKRFDPRRYNGAVFVGLNGICVKSHGGTDEYGFSRAIGVAIDLASRGFNERIKDDLGHLMAAAPTDVRAAAL